MDKYTQQIFDLVTVSLERLMPAIAKINWTRYGSQYKLYDENGVPKYQGMVLQLYPGIKSSELVSTIGVIPNREKSLLVLGAKLDSLLTSKDYTSLEMRDPPRIWGGAIKVSGAFDIWGVTGLPEIADHLVLAFTLFAIGQCNGVQILDWVSEETQHVQAAMRDAGMSKEQYLALKKSVWGIISRGIKDSS